MAKRRVPDPWNAPKSFFGAELRLRREAAGMTQAELGELLFCSYSQISHYEAAFRRPLPDVAERLDEVFNTDGIFSRMSEMINQSSRHAEYFTAAAELEICAQTISEYAPVFVPGLLQTEAYAHAIIRAADPVATTGTVADRVAARVSRASLLSDPAAPRLWFVLDESVIRRPVGAPAVMREQLHHIRYLIRSNRVLVQVLPFSAGAPALGSMTSFMTFTDGPPVVYCEVPHSGQLLDDPALVSRCFRSYDLTRAAALSPEVSLSLIESAAEDYAKNEHRP
jgi:transcriptional regulator with XRE-family HTH domain